MKKKDAEPERCPYCRHLLPSECNHGNCRVCHVLVLRDSACYPSGRVA